MSLKMIELEEPKNTYSYTDDHIQKMMAECIGEDNVKLMSS